MALTEGQRTKISKKLNDFVIVGVGIRRQIVILVFLVFIDGMRQYVNGISSQESNSRVTFQTHL